jgi:hypothetical protein
MYLHLWNDETGVVLSSELVLVLTTAVLSTVVGLAEMSSSTVAELNDLSNAVGAMNQTFGVTGYESEMSNGNLVKSFMSFTGYQDSADDCDTNTSCDIITGVASTVYNTSTGG